MGASYSNVNRLGTEITKLNETRIETNIRGSLVKQLPLRTLCDYQPFYGTGTAANVATAPTLSMSTLSESATTGMGDVTSTFTLTDRTLTAALKAVDVVLTKVALEASVGNITQLIINAGTRAGIVTLETDFCALYTEAPSTAPDHEIGVQGGGWDWATILAGQELLMTQSAPGPYAVLAHTSDFSSLMTIPELTEAQIFGRGVIEQGANLDTGQVYVGNNNLMFYCSNNVTQSSGNRNMMFAKDGIGIRMKQDFTVSIDRSRLDVGERAIIIGMELWYAVGGTRNSSTTNKYIVEILT